MRKNNKQFKKVFTTLDSYISGYLTLKGFIPELIGQDGKIVFVFNSSDALYQAIADYNNGAIVSASQLALVVKTLKSQIHSLRRSK
jgi:hypothetical protein